MRLLLRFTKVMSMYNIRSGAYGVYTNAPLGAMLSFYTIVT